VPSTGKETKKFGGWEAEVVCGPNTQAKSIILDHDKFNGMQLNELRVAGLPSNKFECDLGWKPGTQTCSRCPPGSYTTSRGFVAVIRPRIYTYLLTINPLE
jgi:hypothetical protein